MTETTDAAIIDQLVEAAGGVKAFADAVGVTRQSIWEWRTRLTDSARIRISVYAEEKGIKLPRDFLKRAL